MVSLWALPGANGVLNGATTPDTQERQLHPDSDCDAEGIVSGVHAFSQFSTRLAGTFCWIMIIVPVETRLVGLEISNRTDIFPQFH